MNKDDEVKGKLSKARARLVLDHPFFGSLALRLELLEDNMNNPTLCTNGKNIRYNSDFIKKLSLDEVRGVLCHEVMHCANQHMSRRDDRDEILWNIACDYAINSILVNCGLSLPDGSLVDSAFQDMSAEEIYSKLPPQPPEMLKGLDPGGCGRVEDSDTGEAQKNQTAQEWKIAVAQAAQQAKSIGEFPGALDRVIGDLIEPVLDWRELLRRFVDTTAKNDYQWFPPNRRYIGAGLILPSLRSQELKNVTMVIDTSGSITDRDLQSFEAEVRSIIQDYRANTKVIYCDAAVQAVEEFDADSLVELHPRGGGGTDFRPPFDHVEDSGEAPACLIYQTDGWCNSFPDKEPSYPVLWVLTSKREFNPPFGEVINL
jgi:predicted metal-dependent peptidase